jgi:hypothetical protein
METRALPDNAGNRHRGDTLNAQGAVCAKECLELEHRVETTQQELAGSSLRGLRVRSGYWRGAERTGGVVA